MASAGAITSFALRIANGPLRAIRRASCIASSSTCTDGTSRLTRPISAADGARIRPGAARRPHDTHRTPCLNPAFVWTCQW